MLLSKSSLIKHPLKFTKLANNPQYLSLIAQWMEDEWGYLHNKDESYYKRLMNRLKNNVFIGMYGEHPVAMFVLLEHEFHEDSIDLPRPEQLPQACLLRYAYVEKKYRGLGFGRQILDEAHCLANEMEANLLLFETLKPGLNRMFENYGAKFLCEHHFFSHNIDVLSRAC